MIRSRHVAIAATTEPPMWTYRSGPASRWAASADARGVCLATTWAIGPHVRLGINALLARAEMLGKLSNPPSDLSSALLTRNLMVAY
jgi:hypothetical protein